MDNGKTNGTVAKAATKNRMEIQHHLVSLDRDPGNAEMVDALIRVRMNGLLHPALTVSVAMEAIDERARQDVKWGDQFHPDLPAGVTNPCAWFGIAAADAARMRCEDAFRRGMGSYAHVLLEEVSEAIEDANNPERLRTELVQVAGTAMKWIEAIDRRAADCKCTPGVICKSPDCARLPSQAEGVTHG